MKKILLLGILALLSFLITGCTTDKIPDNQIMKISLSEISDQASFYEFEGIKYFAVLGSDGIPRTAFDACDVCGGFKGYEQQGNDIKCRNCGKVFKIDGLGGENKGYGCWPSHLPHKVKGTEILIKVNDIEKSRHRFV